MPKVRLSSAYDEFSGLFGGFCLVRGRGGNVVRRRPVYRRPTSAGQFASSQRLRAAAAAYNALTDAQAGRWVAYAASLPPRTSFSGKRVAMTAQNAFVMLAVRVLQIDPLAPIPVDPPTGVFYGDETQISATGVPGAARFTASGPNAPGVVTELLLQRLATPRRNPGPQYRSERFAHFEVGGLTSDVAVAPGRYACAARFAEQATGRVGLMQPLGVVVVTE